MHISTAAATAACLMLGSMGGALEDSGELSLY